MASALSLIWAADSGDAARREETVARGFLRLSGIMEGELESSSESISRAERPRWVVRALAEARTAGGVRYGRGND